MCFLLFGGTGDLASKKILPALNALDINNIFVIGTKFKTQDEFVESMGNDYSNVMYIKHPIKKLHGTKHPKDIYGKNIAEVLNYRIRRQKNIIIYVALYGDTLINSLNEIKGVVNNASFKNIKIVLDKPVGRNINECRYIIDKLNNIDKSKNIHVIYTDYYLYKSLSSKNLYNPCLNSTNVHLMFAQNRINPNRKKFLKEVNVIEDMVQSHALFVLKKFTNFQMPFPVRDYSIKNVIRDNKNMSIEFIIHELPTGRTAKISIINNGVIEKNIIYDNNTCMCIDLGFEKPCKAYYRMLDAIINSRKDIIHITAKDVIKNWEICNKITKEEIPENR